MTDYWSIDSHIFKHFTDVVVLAVIIAFFFVSVTGWGQLVLNSSKLNRSKNILFFPTWCGLVVAVIFVEALHFIAPIDWSISAIFALIGVFVYASNWSQIKPNFIRYRKIKNYFFSMLILICWGYIAIAKTMIPSNHYDVDLYYLQTIKWLNEYPITWGLGNLHSRLGFNQSLFSLAALLNIFPVWNHGISVINLFVGFLALSTVISSLAYVHSTRSSLLLIVSIVCFTVLYDVGSPSPDATIGYLQCVIFFVLIVIFTNKDNDKATDTNGLCGLLLVLCTLSIVIKLSSLVFAIASLAIATNKLKQWITVDTKLALKIMTLCMGLFFLHACRGYVLTGYPLYPSTILGWVGAPWALSLETVNNEVAWIYTAARQSGRLPEEVLGNWSWLDSWLAAVPLRIWVISVFSIIFIACDFFQFKTSSYTRKQTGTTNLKIIYLPLLASLVFWFFTAPDIRFLGLVPELFLILSAYGLTLKLIHANIQIKEYSLFNWILITLLISCTVDFFANFRILQDMLATLGIKKFFARQPNADIEFMVQSLNWNIVTLSLIILFFIIYSSNLVVSPGVAIYRRIALTVLTVGIVSQISLSMGFFWNDQFGWRRRPELRYVQSIFPDGAINIPTNGDQCGEAPLPCAPSMNSQLRVTPPPTVLIGNQTYSYSSNK